MRIALCSDLHLEFGNIKLENTENADILILSGDICVAKDLYNEGTSKESVYLEFFENCSRNFPNVLYVAGNHEHYHGDFDDTIIILKDKLSKYANIKVLDKETIDLGGYTFIGGTLWTDMDNGNPSTMMTIARSMNDFRCVRNSRNKVNFKTIDEETSQVTFHTRPANFTPEDAMIDHAQMVEFIQKTIEMNPEGKYVVVGHHSPSKKSTHPRYADDVVINCGYSSDLDQFIERHPQIKMWTHGHTHHTFDYIVGETRIVCNPRGYDGYEQRADDFKLEFFDL